MYISVVSDCMMTILYSGKVIGPTFQFDVSEIKFGLVSCGKSIIIIMGKHLIL